MTMYTSSTLLAELAAGGHIKEADHKAIASAREDLFVKVACDLVTLGFMEVFEAKDASLTKTAGFMDMLKNLSFLGQGRINPDVQKLDPNVYNALQKSYQAGGADARKSFPHSAMSLGSPWRTAAALMALAMGARAVGEGVASGKDWLHRRNLGKEIDISRHQMFEKFPDLDENREIADETFNLLSSYSPAMAANPIVAGTFVQTSLSRSDPGSAPFIGPAEVKVLLDNQMSAERIRDIADPGVKRLGEGVKKDVGDIMGAMIGGNIL